MGLSSATQRDLSVNKVDLTSEVKNILPKVNMDLTGIVKTSDLGDYETISDLQTNYATKSSVSAKINTIDIVDNLNSTEIYKPLSANQGNIINGILNNKLEVTDIEAGTNVSLNVVGNKVTINSTGGGTELTEEQESKINGIITNGDGTKVKTDDGTYKTINNNINKSIIINSSDWALDNSTNTYKVTITHGLKTKNIIPVMYDGDEDAGLLGYRRIGIDNIMLENDTAISGELIVNCSSSLDVEKETIIVSATSPLAKYTSLETCFSTETEGEKTISLLKETYDVLNTGLHMKKGWTLKGIAPDSTKIIMHTDGGHTIQQWVDGFFATVDCTIQDLTIESYNNDVYCIHADANNNTDEFDIWIKNCILRRTKDTLAPFINNTNGGQALGIGMTSGQRIHVYDSQIIACPITDIITSASINMHNWADNGGGKPSLFDFKNCTIIGGTYAGLVTNFRTSSDNIRDTIIFDNCNIEGGLMIEGNNYSQNAFIWNVNSECPRMKTFNGTCQSFPLSNGRKYLKNIGISNIVKGDAVCYVYQSKQYSWHQIGTFIMTPTGIEKLNASNKDYFAGFALNNCTINNYGYIQTKDLVFSNTNASTLFSYLIVDSSGTLVVDNTSPHYIGQTVGNSAGENLIKLKN